MELRLTIGKLNIGWDGASASDAALAQAEAAIARYPLPSSGGDVPEYPDAMMFQPQGLGALQINAPDIARRVVIVRRCALLIANDVASLPVVFERQKGRRWEPIERKPYNIVDVWERANPVDTSFEMVRDWIANYKATGNGYLEAETFRMPNGAPQELWPLRSHLVEILPGRRRIPAAFLYDRNGRKEKIEPENMIHLRGWNTNEEAIGGSDLDSVDVQCAARAELNQLVLAFLRSGGMGGGFFRVEIPNNVTAEKMSETQREELERKLNRERFGGKDFFRRRLLPLLKWERQSLSPKDLGTSEMRRDIDLDVCMAFGVSPWMVNIKSGGGGNIGADKSGSETDVDNYIERTLKPELRLVQSVLTEKLCPLFGEVGVRARIDLSGLSSLVQKRISLGTQVAAMLGPSRAFISVNTARKFIEEEPDPNPKFDQIPEDAAPAEPSGAAQPEAAPTQTAPDGKAEKKSRALEPIDQARRRHKVRLAQYERTFARLFIARVFDPQERRTIDALRSEWDRSLVRKSRIDIARVLEVDYDDEEAIRDILEELILLRGEEAAAQVFVELDIALHKARAAAFVRAQAGRLITRTSDTTRKAVADAIAEAELNDATFGELAAAVRKAFDGRRENAVTIARTETGRAYNFAAREAWRDVPEVVGWRWITANDDVVREAHQDVHEDLALKGEPFLMQNPDTAEMITIEYPGDPEAPAWATINCRCALNPELDPDAIRSREWARWWAGGDAIRAERGA